MIAKDATVRQILTEWARVGHTGMVIERSPADDDDRPQRHRSTGARGLLQRSAAQPAPYRSRRPRFDRIIVMPTLAARAPRSAAPPPVYQQQRHRVHAAAQSCSRRTTIPTAGGASHRPAARAGLSRSPPTLPGLRGSSPIPAAPTTVSRQRPATPVARSPTRRPARRFPASRAVWRRRRRMVAPHTPPSPDSSSPADRAARAPSGGRQRTRHVASLTTERGDRRRVRRHPSSVDGAAHAQDRAHQPRVERPRADGAESQGVATLVTARGPIEQFTNEGARPRRQELAEIACSKPTCRRRPAVPRRTGGCHPGTGHLAQSMGR